MKIVVVDTSHNILTEFVSDARIPVKGDNICFTITTQPRLVDADLEHVDRTVLKVMIDYIQEIAFVPGCPPPNPFFFYISSN